MNHYYTLAVSDAARIGCGLLILIGIVGAVLAGIGDWIRPDPPMRITVIVLIVAAIAAVVLAGYRLKAADSAAMTPGAAPGRLGRATTARVRADVPAMPELR